MSCYTQNTVWIFIRIAFKIELGRIDIFLVLSISFFEHWAFMCFNTIYNSSLHKVFACVCLYGHCVFSLFINILITVFVYYIQKQINFLDGHLDKLSHYFQYFKEIISNSFIWKISLFLVSSPYVLQRMLTSLDAYHLFLTFTKRTPWILTHFNSCIIDFSHHCAKIFDSILCWVLEAAPEK